MTFLGGPRGKVSTNNSSSANILADSSFDGDYENVSQYSYVTVLVKSDQDSAENGISMNFSSNGTTAHKVYVYTLYKNQSKTFSLPIFTKYFKITYTNGSTQIGTFVIQTIYHNTKNINNFGEVLTTGVDLVKVDNPSSSFGELYSVTLKPLVELDFVYGSLSYRITELKGNGGTVTTPDSPFITINSGTTVNGYAGFNSVKLANYRPGQGLDSRFTTVYETGGVANTTQIVGIGNETNGFFFGYNGTDFGVLRKTSGNYDIRILTITSAASSSDNITIELNGNSVTDIPVTVDTIGINAFEISEYDFSSVGSGWTAKSNGNEVIFISLYSETKSGNFSFTDSGSTGLNASFTYNLAGTAPVNDWIPQISWNIDKADGSNILPLINFANGNVFQIKYQWLGFGTIVYSIENPSTGEFTDVHRIEYANTVSETSTANPKVPLFCSVSTNTTSSVQLKLPSMCCLLAGEVPLTKPLSFSTSNAINIAANNFYAILSIRNKEIFNGIKNTADSNIANITIYHGHGKATEFRIVKNTTIISNNVNYTNTETSETIIDYYKPSTSAEEAISGGITIYSTVAGPTSRIEIDISNIDITLRPSETITVVAKNLESSNAALLSCTINWIDDI